MKGSVEWMGGFCDRSGFKLFSSSSLSFFFVREKVDINDENDGL